MALTRRHIATLLLGSVAVYLHRSALAAPQQPPPQTASSTGPTIQTHQALARRYLGENKPTLAIPEFAAVVAADPANLDAQANLGVLLYFTGQFAAAEPHLRAALHLDPAQSKVQALLGSCEHRLGNLAGAREDLSAALPHLGEPKIHRQMALELVEVDTAAGDLASAAVVLNQLKTTSGSDPEILYAAYRVYTDLASEAMLDLSLAAPDSAQMHQAMAHELARERDTAGAIKNFRAALALDPQLPGAHFELAELLAASSDPTLKAEAKQQYTLALKANPADEKALTRLGDIAAARADHTAAMDLYNQALALRPTDIDASIGLSHELAETGHLDAALAPLLRARTEDPTDLLVHFRLSTVYRRLGRTEDAKREAAEYARLKALREKLRGVYDAMRLDTPKMDAPKTGDPKE